MSEPKSARELAEAIKEECFDSWRMDKEAKQYQGAFDTEDAVPLIDTYIAARITEAAERGVTWLALPETQRPYYMTGPDATWQQTSLRTTIMGDHVAKAGKMVGPSECNHKWYIMDGYRHCHKCGAGEQFPNDEKALNACKAPDSPDHMTDAEAVEEALKAADWVDPHLHAEHGRVLAAEVRRLRVDIQAAIDRAVAEERAEVHSCSTCRHQTGRHGDDCDRPISEPHCESPYNSAWEARTPRSEPPAPESGEWPWNEGRYQLAEEICLLIEKVVEDADEVFLPIPEVDDMIAAFIARIPRPEPTPTALAYIKELETVLATLIPDGTNYKDVIDNPAKYKPHPEPRQTAEYPIPMPDYEDEHGIKRHAVPLTRQTAGEVEAEAIREGIREIRNKANRALAEPDDMDSAVFVGIATMCDALLARQPAESKADHP